MVWHPGTGLGLAKIVVVKRRYVCLSHKYAHTYRYQSWYEVTIFGDPQLLGRTHHNYRRLLLAYIQSCTGTHSSPWPFPSVPAKKIFPLLLVPMSIHLYVLLIIIIFVIIQLTRRWMSTNRRPGYESCMVHYFTLSYERDPKQVAGGFFSHWRHSSITVKCVSISAFLLYLRAVPQHLFPIPSHCIPAQSTRSRHPRSRVVLRYCFF